MILQYLMDENVDPVYVNQLRRKTRDLVVWAIGEPYTPPKGTLEPKIMLWCEVNNFILKFLKLMGGVGLEPT
jgi:hypothetical protein